MAAGAPGREVRGAAPTVRPADELRPRLAPLLFRPLIATRRLLLRPLRADDADALVATLGEPGVARMLASVPLPYTRQNAEGYLRFVSASAAARRSLICGVDRDGRLIGVVSLDNIPRRPRLGYWIDRAYWGRGYGTEAVAALVAYAFRVLKVPLIRAGVFVDNSASLRVLGRLGFRAIGIRNGVSAAREERVDFVATVLTRRRYTAPHRPF